MPDRDPTSSGVFRASEMRSNLRRWSVERWLLVLTFISSLAAMVFGLGVNWAHISEQDSRQKAFEELANRTFVRADVYAAEQRSLSESLDRLTRTLERIQDSRDKTQPRGRMFDR